MDIEKKMSVLLGDGTAGHGHGWGLRPIREGKKTSRKISREINPQFQHHLFLKSSDISVCIYVVYLLTSDTVLATL